MECQMFCWLGRVSCCVDAISVASCHYKKNRLYCYTYCNNNSSNNDNNNNNNHIYIYCRCIPDVATAQTCPKLRSQVTECGPFGRTGPDLWPLRTIPHRPVSRRERPRASSNTRANRCASHAPRDARRGRRTTGPRRGPFLFRRGVMLF